MGAFMETLYDLVFQPASAMRRIAADKKICQAAAAFLVSTLLPMLALYSGLKTVNFEAFAGAIAVLQVVGSLVFWFVSAAILGLTAELFGGQGSAAGLFAALGFVHIPKLFVLPLWAAALLLSPGARPFWLMAGMLLLAVWVLYLEIAAIKGAYSVSGSKAVLVLLFPLAALLFLGLTTVVFLGISIISAMPMHWR